MSSVDGEFDNEFDVVKHISVMLVLDKICPLSNQPRTRGIVSNKIIIKNTEQAYLLPEDQLEYIVGSEVDFTH